MEPSATEAWRAGALLVGVLQVRALELVMLSFGASFTIFLALNPKP